jgi:ATP-dependent helicase/DNAse subunit B
LGLEDKDIVYNVELQLGNKSKSIQMKGSIDRVDRKDGIMRVLDYKTGSDSNTFEYEALFERDNNKRNKAAYQVLLYSVMHSKRHSENANYWAGLFSRSEMFQNGFSPVLKEKREIFEFTTKIQQEFEVNTNALLSEIFLSDEPFSQTEDLKKCQYCPYNIFCKR